jgi:hypothetical protein
LGQIIFANHVKLWRDIFGGKFGGAKVWRDIFGGKFGNFIFGDFGGRGGDFENWGKLLSSSPGIFKKVTIGSVLSTGVNQNMYSDEGLIQTPKSLIRTYPSIYLSIYLYRHASLGCCF